MSTAEHSARLLRLGFFLLVSAAFFVHSCGGGGSFSGTGTGNVPNPIDEPRIEILATVPNPSSLAVRNGDLFFSDASETPLKKLVLATGEVSPLANKIGSIPSMVVRGSSLFWVDARGSSGYTKILKKTSLDGSGSTALQSGNIPPYSGTSSIAANDENVFWVTSSEAPGTYDLVKVSIDGRTSTTIASSSNQIVGVAADATHVYWEEFDWSTPELIAVIRRAPVSGGDSEVLASGFRRFTGGMAVYGSELFFSDTSDGSTPVCRIMKIPVSGGAAVVLETGSRPARGIAVDGTSVFWADLASIACVPTNGGTVTALATPAYAPSAITLDASGVIWSEAYTGPFTSMKGDVKRVPKAGGATTVLAEGLETPGALAFDPSSGYLYWAEGSYMEKGSGRIGKVPSAGGAASSFETGVESSSPRIVVDTDHVYVADGAFIKKVSVAGGPLEPLVTSTQKVSDLATDGDNVYWIDILGAVFRVPADGGSVTPLSTTHLGTSTGAIRISEGYVYWTGYKAIMRVPVGGGAESTVIDAFPSDFTVDAGFVYFSEQDSGGIFKAPAAGGTIVKVGDGLSLSYNVLAVDNVSLYWIDQLHLGRIPLDGATGSSRIANVTTSIDFIRPSLALDNEYIYWTDWTNWMATGGGEIRRRLR